MCAHRIDVGLEPACVIGVSDRGDPGRRPQRSRRRRSRSSSQREPVAVRTPGEGDQAGRVLPRRAPGDAGPAGRPRPDGGLYAWATQGAGPSRMSPPGHPRPAELLGGGAAVLRHPAPRAVGMAGQPLHLDQEDRRRRVPASRCCWSPACWAGTTAWPGWAAPVLALALPRRHRGPADLGSQAPVALLSDLHPASLVELVGPRRVHHRRLRRRGHRATCCGITDRRPPRPARSLGGLRACRWPSAPPVYTAYLFAQAKARDLWQSPLLAPHLAVQAVVAGAARCCRSPAWLSPDRGVAGARGWSWPRPPRSICSWSRARSTLAARHRPRPAGDARMRRGRYRGPFGPGSPSSRPRSAAPWIGIVAAPLALAGLLAHEHAYVQAGQSVPLA